MPQVPWQVKYKWDQWVIRPIKNVYRFIIHEPNAKRACKKHDEKTMLRALRYQRREYVRFEALECLREWANPAFIDPLLDMLRHEPHDYYRAEVAHVLWRYPEPRVVDALTQALQDSYHGVRNRAVESLNLLNSNKCDISLAIPRIIELLKDTDSGDTRELIRTLLDHGKPASVDAVVDFVEKTDPAQLDQALEAIGYFLALSGEKKESMGPELVKRLVQARCIRAIHPPAPEIENGVPCVKKMDIVHYFLVDRSLDSIQTMSYDLQNFNKCVWRIPKGDVTDLTDGISLLTAKAKDYQEVMLTPELLEWAAELVQRLDLATEAGRSPFPNWGEVLRYFQNAYAIAPDYPLTVMSIGVAYGRLGEADRAIEWLEQAAALAPHSERICQNLEGVRRSFGK